MDNEKKQYQGYGYHGGGRPRKAENLKAKTLSISAPADELQAIRESAAAAGLSVGAYVVKLYKLHNNAIL